MPFGQRFQGKAGSLAPISTGWIEPTLGPKDTGYLTPGRKNYKQKGRPKKPTLVERMQASMRGLL